MTLDARVAERTRIARELHDTLLQSFHGLLLRFQTAFDLLPDRPAESKQVLASAIDQAAEAITEGRDAVQGLRASTVEMNDLALAINARRGARDGVDARGSLRVGVLGRRRSCIRSFVTRSIRLPPRRSGTRFRHAGARADRSGTPL